MEILLNRSPQQKSPLIKRGLNNHQQLELLTAFSIMIRLHFHRSWTLRIVSYSSSRPTILFYVRVFSKDSYGRFLWKIHIEGSYWRFLLNSLTEDSYYSLNRTKTFPTHRWYRTLEKRNENMRNYLNLLVYGRHIGIWSNMKPNA